MIRKRTEVKPAYKRVKGIDDHYLKETTYLVEIPTTGAVVVDPKNVSERTYMRINKKTKEPHGLISLTRSGQIIGWDNCRCGAYFLYCKCVNGIRQPSCVEHIMKNYPDLGKSLEKLGQVIPKHVKLDSDRPIRKKRMPKGK